MVDVIDALIDDDLTHYMKACLRLRGELEDAKNIARRLLRERDEARARNKDFEVKVDTLASQVNHLESDRDEAIRSRNMALDERTAAMTEYVRIRQELDELRAQNTELKALLVDVDKERLALREALEQVEFDGNDESGYYYCLWCKSSEIHGHAPDCARQRALGKA
jgi:chromosome segregation ATPase